MAMADVAPIFDPDPSSPAGLGPWSIIGAAVLWGTTGTAQALAPDGALAPAVGALRLIIGGLALVLLASSLGDIPLAPDWVGVVLGLATLALTPLCLALAACSRSTQG